MDITGTVDVNNPAAVARAIQQLFNQRYPDGDFALLTTVFADFDALYGGSFPGYLGCETRYHDLHHVLDVTLAMARLVDGYDKVQPKTLRLGPDKALLGVIVALFHDAGYIRRNSETDISHGAEYTLVHVSRSASFLQQYLPSIGMAKWSELAAKLVHFTGYELSPEQIELPDNDWRILGFLIGTADVIAQMADPDYLQKCRDNLFPEFEMGGVARQRKADGSEQVLYASAEDLLVKTPGFISDTLQKRLRGHFQSVYRYLEQHFNGSNPYMEGLEHNRRFLEKLLAQNDVSLLRYSLRPH